MDARVGWVLNLDADLELGARGPYTPPSSVKDATRIHQRRLAAALLAPADLLVDDAAPVGSARGLLGRAFCPTPRALALLERAGAVPEPHPPVGVLRRVNSRAFAASLGPTLPHAAFVTDADAALEALARAPSGFGAWRVKRAFGMAGRGQRVVAGGALSRADAAFVRASVSLHGGVMLEPDVAIVDEYALHGRLAEDGALVLGAVVRQRCDERGAWVATEPALDLGPSLEAALRDEASVVARALHAAGYFGPFGVDAFTYRAPDGGTALQPRSEINARYTMGFAVGFARTGHPLPSRR